MATFVLVHGMGGGGWCWKRVTDRLRAQGHEVFTPTLTGLGERSHLLSPEIDLGTHIADIANVLKWESLTDVILVGHSYGGMPVTGAADRERDRVATLIYLDAFMPENGQSVMDLQPPDRRDVYYEMAAEKGDGWRLVPLPSEFWKLTDPDDIAWNDALKTDHPLATLEQPIRLENGPHPRRAYIWASGFQPSPFVPLAEKARNDPAWIYDEIDGGHLLMMSHADDVTEKLLHIGVETA
jgi:pimeloyl-ACP methyl ester carboxylesterase